MTQVEVDILNSLIADAAREVEAAEMSVKRDNALDALTDALAYFISCGGSHAEVIQLLNSSV